VALGRVAFEKILLPCSGSTSLWQSQP